MYYNALTSQNKKFRVNNLEKLINKLGKLVNKLKNW